MTQKYNISQCFKRKIILCASKSDWRRYVHRNMLDFDDKRRWFWIQERKKLKISRTTNKINGYVNDVFSCSSCFGTFYKLGNQ